MHPSTLGSLSSSQALSHLRRCWGCPPNSVPALATTRIPGEAAEGGRTGPRPRWSVVTVRRHQDGPGPVPLHSSRTRPRRSPTPPPPLPPIARLRRCLESSDTFPSRVSSRQPTCPRPLAPQVCGVELRGPPLSDLPLHGRPHAASTLHSLSCLPTHSLLARCRRPVCPQPMWPELTLVPTQHQLPRMLVPDWWVDALGSSKAGGGLASRGQGAAQGRGNSRVDGRKGKVHAALNQGNGCLLAFRGRRGHGHPSPLSHPRSHPHTGWGGDRCHLCAADYFMSPDGAACSKCPNGTSLGFGNTARHCRCAPEREALFRAAHQCRSPLSCRALQTPGARPRASSGTPLWPRPAVSRRRGARALPTGSTTPASAAAW
jgi:hypothetical protein